MTEIARGEINVTLNDREAVEGLRKVDREFDRTMDRIDRREAEASVGANLTELRKDLRQAEALVKQWEKKVAEAQTKHQRYYRNQRLRDAQADARSIREDVSAAGQRLAQLKKQNRERNLALAREKSLELAARRQVRQQQRLLKERERNLETARKETLEAAKLQQKYSKLSQQLHQLDQQRSRFLRRFDRPAQLRIRTNMRAIEAEIEATRRRLVALGETPIEIPRDVDRGRLGRWLADLTQMTVRIGPFTTTIAQLSRAMLLLGPIIMGVVGAVGALTGALGAGLVGALGVTAAGLTGFAFAAGGIFAIAKPLVEEFTNIKKASEGYAKAVREHGKGSDQAAKKLKVLHSVMGHMDDRTVEQFKLLGTLGDRWRRLTSDARPEFFRTMGAGIETLNSMMPMLARNSVQAFTAVSQGLRGWMEGLRSVEGQRIIDNIFGRFNDAIPSIMQGLGSLGTAFGRVAESFSRHFVGLGRGFAAWAQGLADATGRTGRLNSGVDKLVGAMRSVGRFTAAAGRVLIQFFRAALGPGVGGLDSMTNSFNNLARSMATVEGQRGLREFFADSLDTTGKLLAALKPIVQLFFEFTTIMRPFTDVALAVVRAVGQVVQALADFGATRLLVQGVVAVWTAWSIAKIIGIAGAIGRVAAAMRALAMGQGGIMALQALFGGPGRGPAARGGNIAKTLGSITAAAAGGSVAAKIVMGLGRALGLIALPAAAAATAALLFGGNAETAATQASDLTRESQTLSEQMTSTSRTFAGSYTNLANNSGNLVSAQTEVARAQRTINALQAHGKSGTQEYRDAVARLNIAIQNRSAAEQQIAESLQVTERHQQNLARSTEAVTSAERAYSTAVGDINNHIDKRDDGYKRLIDRYGSLENAPLPYLQNLKALQGHEDDLQAVLESATGAYNRLSGAQQQQRHQVALAALGTINYQRAIQGLLPVAATAAHSVARLQRTLGTRATGKIAIKFPDPRDAARAMQAVDVAIRNGVSRRRALRIILDAKDAQTGIQRLRAAVNNIPTKTVNIVEKGGDRAVQKLERIKGTRLTPKEQTIAEKGGAPAIALLNKLQRIRLARKEVTITAKDRASGVINSVRAGIGSINSKTVTITVRTRRAGGARTNAEGGVLSPQEKQIARLEDRAAGRVTKNVTGGGVFNRPTFLVGEEDRSEIVISTNQRYRKRNLNFLGMAARALGANATLPDGTILAAEGFAGSGYYAPDRLPAAPPPPSRARGRRRQPLPPRRQRRRQRAVYRSQNAWAAHVAALKTQQDDWEREASLRQQAIVEPEDLIREVGRTPVITDPETGEKSGGEPIYEADQDAINKLTADIAAVREAYAKLVAITAAIVAAVPKAIAAGRAEMEVRRDNITTLRGEITRARRRKRATSKDDQKRKYDEQIDRAQRRIDREQAAIEALKDDEKTFQDDGKAAGFDFREHTINRDEQQREIDALGGRAEREVTQSNPQPDTKSTASGGTGGVDGSGGASGPSTLEQVANLSNARGELLRQFGGNSRNLRNFGATVGRSRGAFGGGAFSGFGSHIQRSSGGFGAGGAVGSMFAPAPGASSPASGSGGGGDTYVNVTNNYQEPPPDPHTWSRQMAWELQAAT